MCGNFDRGCFLAGILQISPSSGQERLHADDRDPRPEALVSSPLWLPCGFSRFLVDIPLTAFGNFLILLLVNLFLHAPSSPTLASYPGGSPSLFHKCCHYYDRASVNRIRNPRIPMPIDIRDVFSLIFRFPHLVACPLTRSSCNRSMCFPRLNPIPIPVLVHAQPYTYPYSLSQRQ